VNHEVEVTCPLCHVEVTLRLIITMNYAGRVLSGSPRYVSDHTCPLDGMPS
jgi:hypothetical protein